MRTIVCDVNDIMNVRITQEMQHYSSNKQIQTIIRVLIQALLLILQSEVKTGTQFYFDIHNNFTSHHPLHILLQYNAKETLNSTKT